jgi:RNA polymerase sigma-70 factor (ECF subfamily)
MENSIEIKKGKAATSSGEHHLVLQLIEGDEQAFCELYAAYKNRLIYFAMQFLESREFAEDIFQDTFAAVWQSRRFINPDASFSSYLYTIVRNRVLNELRKIRSEELLRQLMVAQADDANVENDVKDDGLQEILEQAMTQLTPRQREVFQLSREEELSHKAIAERLGISVNTVQEHISASLKIIRAHINRYSSDTYVSTLLLLMMLMK